ncbi:MAG: peptidoglycan DD-metalloendopeptidase family protein [Alphaproteobacteria bacterium]|nr:peptidoglycan DD-metalloendopeptidase family protein [Alphaproteobacteria bacterium SS10]
MIRVLATAAILALVSLGPEAQAQTPENAEAAARAGAAVESELEQRRARAAALAAQKEQLNNELFQIRETLATNALLLQARENERRDLVERIGDLETRLSLAEARLEEQREELSRLLGGLQRISRIPPEALLSQAQSVGEITRAATIMGNAVPALQTSLEPLRREVATVSDLKQRIESRRVELASLSSELERQDQTLEQLLSDRADRLATTSADHDAEATRVAALAEQAASLQALVQELSRLPDPPAVQETAIRGNAPRLLSPVAGRIARRFGQRDTAGGQADGLVFGVRDGQAVLAPGEGTIRYAGPFRRYGQLVIVDHGAEYHSVLAGPLDLLVQVGQSVRAGEPVARLDREIGTSNSLLQSAVSGSNSSDMPLYFETRFQGRPRNPLQFVAER